MTKERQQPRVTAATGKEAEERWARLARQLRANLGRRKAQQRERAATDAPPESLEENGE